MDYLKRSLASILQRSSSDLDAENLLKTEDGETSFSSNYTFPTTASRSIKKFVLALLPNPVQRRIAPLLYKSPRIHPTSYLDGLRGTYTASLLLIFRISCRTHDASCRIGVA